MNRSLQIQSICPLSRDQCSAAATCSHVLQSTGGTALDRTAPLTLRLAAMQDCCCMHMPPVRCHPRCTHPIGLTVLHPCNAAASSTTANSSPAAAAADPALAVRIGWQRHGGHSRGRNSWNVDWGRYHRAVWGGGCCRPPCQARLVVSNWLFCQTKYFCCRQHTPLQRCCKAASGCALCAARQHSLSISQLSLACCKISSWGQRTSFDYHVFTHVLDNCTL